MDWGSAEALGGEKMNYHCSTITDLLQVVVLQDLKGIKAILRRA